MAEFGLCRVATVGYLGYPENVTPTSECDADEL